MKYSTMFGKTNRASEKQMRFVSSQLLFRGGFVQELTAGRYEYLPLGMRVQQKLIALIDVEMSSLGSQRISIPLLQPLEFWQKTNRDQVWGDELMKIKDRNGRDFVLSATAEGVIMEMIAARQLSYRELPLILHQFLYKFRDEKRSRGGLLRLREFMMKDAYSFHQCAEDLIKTYNDFRLAYQRIFAKLQLPVYACIADNGALGGDYSHEFQVVCASGEDTIIVSEDNEYAANVEKSDAKEAKGKVTLKDGRAAAYHRSIEVGHIFKYDQFYSQHHAGFFTDQDGQRKLMYTGAYGIGIDRTIAATVEIHHDEKGIIWPEAIAPYAVHLLTSARSEEDKAFQESKKIYLQLTDQGVEVLWDDRVNVSLGEKFADADLIGIPTRLVVSEKSMQAGGVELARRDQTETKILSANEVVNIAKSH